MNIDKVKDKLIEAIQSGEFDEVIASTRITKHSDFSRAVEIANSSLRGELDAVAVEGAVDDFREQTKWTVVTEDGETVAITYTKRKY